MQVKIFSERCYDAVRADPTRPIGEIYKAIRNEMTKDMSPEEKETFIEDIPDKNSIGPRLYDHRQNFIPKRPTDFVSIYIYHCIDHDQITNQTKIEQLGNSN